LFSRVSKVAIGLRKPKRDYSRVGDVPRQNRIDDTLGRRAGYLGGGWLLC
jgi:hypothetical protein